MFPIEQSVPMNLFSANIKYVRYYLIVRQGTYPVSFLPRYFVVNLAVKLTLPSRTREKSKLNRPKFHRDMKSDVFKGRKIIKGCHIGLIRFSFIENYGVCECTLSRGTFQFVSYLDLIVDF